MRRLKDWIWRLMGKGPEIAIVSFCTGDPEACRRMTEEVHALLPQHKHFTVTEENWAEVVLPFWPTVIGVPLQMWASNRAKYCL